MVRSAMRQYHVQLDEGDIGTYVLLPGDPGRSEKIASRFDNPRHVMSNREFTTYTGTLDGVTVSVCSTGIGGPSTAIALEELCNVGATTLIRVGTSGALQPELRYGDLVIAQAAIRDDGASHQYAPAAFPAIGDLDVVLALRDAAVTAGRRHHVGIVSSKDSLYSELEMDRMPVAAQLKANWEAGVRYGCLAAEMECATLFVAGQVRRVRTGGVVGVVNTAGAEAEMPDDVKALPIDTTIDTAVDALRLLIARDAR